MITVMGADPMKRATMTKRTMATLGLSALIFGGAAIGTSLTQASIAVAGALDAKAMKQAAGDAAKAQKALASGKIAQAIGFAESAVHFSPQDASYRALLGSAYLRAGRFASARDAFTDSVTLSPADGQIALNLALAQTATGDWASARKTLDDHAALIPVADRGLALALAGDPATAVELLTEAARGPATDAKTRQNLALALALAGRWPEAKSVAALDVTPAEIDDRILQWAAFAHPKAASDQVASLIGVRAVEDQGQPVALALNAQVSPQAAPQPQMADAIDNYMPGKPGDPVAAPVEVASAPVAEAPPVMVAAAAPEISTRPVIVFGARNPVVQALPANYTPANYMPAKMGASRRMAAVRVPAPVLAATSTVSPAPVMAAPAKGGFFVQLGAFENAGVARDGWMKATRRYPALAAQQPSGASVRTAAGQFYRLSVGGFTRGDAVAMCSSYRAHGGSCFVRANAGDQVARWVQAPRQLASR